MNINLDSQKVSNGPNEGLAIPNLIAVYEYDNPEFPLASNSVEVMTLMGAPITEGVAQEMYRTIDKNSGTIILYGFENEDSSLLTFENVFLEDNCWIDAGYYVNLGYPFNTITLSPVRIYRSNDDYVTIEYGKGGRVGGASQTDTQQNSNAGGGTVHDEL